MRRQTKSTEVNLTTLDIATDTNKSRLGAPPNSKEFEGHASQLSAQGRADCARIGSATRTRRKTNANSKPNPKTKTKKPHKNKRKRDGLGGDCTRVRAHLTVAVIGLLGPRKHTIEICSYHNKVRIENNIEELPKQQTHSQT